MPITNFPNQGDDKPVSLANSQWPLFPVGEASDLQRDFPSIWDKGGNIKGNEQFRLLAPMARERRGPRNAAEEQAVRLREAWIARHKGDFQLPGVVAQIKWLAVGDRGLDHMREVINEAKAKLEDKKNFTAPISYEMAGTSLKASFMISTDAIDRQGEIVDQEGWDFTNYMKNPVVLDSHRYESIDDIVGKVVGLPRRKDNGWVVDIEFADSPKGQLAKDLVAKGFINTVSVGFRSIQRRPEGKLTRHIKMELLEVSLVAVPANPEAVRVKAATPFADLPLATINHSWDGPAAEQRVQAHCGARGTDFSNMDWELYRKSHLWVDPEMADRIGGYKLLFADVVDGELKAIPRGLYACAAVLAGARGGVDIPAEDRAGVVEVLGKYYDKMDKELPESIKGDMPEDKPMVKKDIAMLMDLRDKLLEVVSLAEDIIVYYSDEMGGGEDMPAPADGQPADQPAQVEDSAKASVHVPETSVKLVEGIRSLLAAFDRRTN